jgi:hypothetical protein
LVGLWLWRRIQVFSKRPHHDRFADAAFDNPCSRVCCAAEITGKAVAGKRHANVHTDGAFNPTAQQAALIIKTA